MGRVPIVCASDLPDCPEGCGEKWCPKCEKHYFECDRVGPHNAEDYGLEVIEDDDGRLWGIPKSERAGLEGDEREKLENPHERRPYADPAGSDRRRPTPRILRRTDGVAHRMERLKAIGNGQVPAVVAAAWRLLSGDTSCTQ